MSVTQLTMAKSYLQVSHSNDDPLIQLLLDSCEEYVERLCSIALVSAHWHEYLDGGGVALWPAHCPIRSITRIYDEEGMCDVDESVYFLRRNNQIVQDADTRWELGRGRWRVYYVGGYGGDLGIPAGLSLAILTLVRRVYDNRGGRTTENASNWSVSWSELLVGDFARLLTPYIMRPRI